MVFVLLFRRFFRLGRWISEAGGVRRRGGDLVAPGGDLLEGKGFGDPQLEGQPVRAVRVDWGCLLFISSRENVENGVL